MLPRITQSSYSAALGRESQIEPWLAVGQHAACRREELPRNDANQMLPQPDPRSGAEPCRRRGAGCQKKPSSKKDGEVFFLDIPFYRTPAMVAAGDDRSETSHSRSHTQESQDEMTSRDPHGKQLREHVLYLLDGGGAHARFNHAVKDMPDNLRGAKPNGFPHAA